MIAKILMRPFGGFWELKRKANENRSGLKGKIYHALYNMYQYENSSAIGFNSRFAGEAIFPHGEKGIFVSGGSKIGKNCVILQQVTIGSIALPDSNGIGSPTIGDNCYIGAGAMIIGNITVGNNVRIGANTTVYKDVPDNSIVVSAVQKNIPASKELDNKFYTYKNGKRVFFDEGKFKEVTDPKILKIFEDASE